jgi:hypothetical protein
MKKAYITRRFKPESARLIELANRIIAEYEAQGYELTLRQLYYQLVARDVIPNNERSYKNLGSLINDARLAGLVDWMAIEDRTRNVRSNPHWERPRDIIDAAVSQYRIDKWENQAHRIEVWVEKDALVGVIARICGELDLAYFSCRGYTSASELWRAGRRLRDYARNGQIPIVIHLGDHDPSGIDMTRDITERLELFAETPIEIHRIALNWDQIDLYQPPPNPAKLTDSRANGYIAKHGLESWELDALRPEVLAGLIRDEVFSFRNVERWQEMVDREEVERESLRSAAAGLM